MTLLLFQMHRPDADGGGHTLDLVCRWPMRVERLAGLDETRLTALVRRQAAWLERHEMYEWLKLDGKRLKEPHP